VQIESAKRPRHRWTETSFDLLRRLVRFLPYDIEPVIHQLFGNRLDGNVINLGNL
jgi:hypothetical protein